MTRTETRPRSTNDPGTAVDSARPTPEVEVVARRAPVIGPQQILAAAGGIAILVAGFLEWMASGAGFLDGAEGRQIPFEFLWDRTPEGGDPSLLIGLIPIGVVALVSALWFGSIGLRALSGVAALALVGVFAYQFSESLDAAGPGAGGVFDHLGVGWYVATVGGLITLIAAFVPLAITRRVTTVPPA